MTFTLKVTIAGIDVTSYVSTGFTEDSLSLEISQAELRANHGIMDAVSLSGGQTVKIWRDYDGSFTDSDLIFDGQIESFDEENYQYKIICYDQLNITKARAVAYVYLDSGAEAGKLSEIFKSLINNYTTLSATAGSVQDSGTAQTLAQFICRNAYVYERAKKLAQALNWRFYYDPQTALVYFEPVRYTANPNQITSANLASKPVWTEDKSELANAITVQGARIQTRTQESFAGPASSVTLVYKPDEMKVTVGGVLKTGGQEGDADIDYYFDKETKTVTFLAASSTIVIDYAYSSPLTLYSENSTSVATYGIWEKVLTLLDTSSIGDLQNRLSAALSLYAFPFSICMANVKNLQKYDYRVWQSVQVTDPYTSQTGIYTIRKITRNLRLFYDEMEFGDKEFRFEGWLAFDLEYRIKKLEEESAKDTSVISRLIQFAHTPTARRKSRTMSVSPINDSALLDHPINGQCERGQILDDFETTPTVNWSGTSCSLAEET